MNPGYFFSISWSSLSAEWDTGCTESVLMHTRYGTIWTGCTRPWARISEITWGREEKRRLNLDSLSTNKILGRLNKRIAHDQTFLKAKFEVKMDFP